MPVIQGWASAFDASQVRAAAELGEGTCNTASSVERCQRRRSCTETGLPESEVKWSEGKDKDFGDCWPRIQILGQPLTCPGSSGSLLFATWKTGEDCPTRLVKMKSDHGYENTWTGACHPGGVQPAVSSLIPQRIYLQRLHKC